MTIGQIAARSAYIPKSTAPKLPASTPTSTTSWSTPAAHLSVSLQAAAAYYTAQATVDDPTKDRRLTAHSPNFVLVSNAAPLPHSADLLVPASVRNADASAQASAWSTSMSTRFSIQTSP